MLGGVEFFYMPTNALLNTIIYQFKMSVLKHLKLLQHVSIAIQIIFRGLVGSLLKSLNLKVFKIVKADCGDAAASPQSAFTILKNF